MPSATAKPDDEPPTRGRRLWDAPVDPDAPLGRHLTLRLTPDGDEPEFDDEDGRRCVPPPERARTLRKMAAEWLERERREARPTLADRECRKCHIAREEEGD